MKYFIIFIICIGLISCTSKKETEVATVASGNDSMVSLTDVQMKQAGIDTSRMQQRDISSVLRLNGIIEVPPQNMVSISLPLGGYLKSTKLLPGMHVSKGEVIAIVQDQRYVQLQEDYLTAKARVDYLKNDYQRQKDLNVDQASSDKTFQAAEADYNTQLVLIKALAEKLQLVGINVSRLTPENISGNLNVYSPITGYVSRVNVNIGKYVSPTEVMFELINPDDIHLALKAYEKDIDKMYVGQPLVAFTNNDPAKKYPCEILLIGKDLSLERSTDVHCHFETYDHALLPGTYMNAEVQVKQKLAWCLPDEAVVSFENKQFVYRAMGSGKYEMVEVETGDSEDGYTAINIPEKSDLTSASFVVKGAYSLLMMMKNTEE